LGGGQCGKEAARARGGRVQFGGGEVGGRQVRIAGSLVKLEKRRTFAAIAAVVRFFMVFLFAVRAASAQQPSSLSSSITETVQQRIAKSGADVAIVLERLDGSLRWSLNGDEAFHAASTMKIPVMMELFHQAHDRKLKLDDPLLVQNQFHSIVDDSTYQLNPADDSETELYKAVGQPRTLTQLCVLMITVSSNLATNLLIEKLGVQNIRATIHEFGADGMNVLRGVEDQKAFDRGLNNTTSARGLAVLLETMANGRAFDAEASRQMVAILQQQTFNEGIPAGLPAGTRIAHKTGEITKIHHDAAIVYAPKPFVLVILVRGMQDFKQSSQLIADLTRLLYPATR
jgi:beta-lactamase class A